MALADGLQGARQACELFDAHTPLGVLALISMEPFVSMGSPPKPLPAVRGADMIRVIGTHTFAPWRTPSEMGALRSPVLPMARATSPCQGP